MPDDADVMECGETIDHDAKETGRGDGEVVFVCTRCGAEIIEKLPDGEA